MVFVFPHVPKCGGTAATPLHSNHIDPCQSSSFEAFNGSTLYEFRT